MNLMTDKRADPWSFPLVPVAICGYEVLALAARRNPGLRRMLPTITTLMHRHPWMKPVFIGTLAWHLLNEKE